MRAALPPLLVLAILLGAASPAAAQERDRGALGLGLILGSPTGLSLEYSLGESSSLHFALGVDGFDNRGRDDDFYFHVMWRFYLAELASTPDFTLPVYIGVGPFVSDLGDDNIGLGARVPFGIAMSFANAPIDIFLEIPVYLQVIDDVDLAIGAALGFHYFF
jgi:hypothetical protein